MDFQCPFESGVGSKDAAMDVRSGLGTSGTCRNLGGAATVMVTQSWLLNGDLGTNPMN
jgi:hypothetical protein